MSSQRAFIGLVGVLLLAMQLLLAASTYACSAGLDFNPVAEAEVIVGGRVTAWQRLPADPGAPFTPVQITLAVDQRINGESDTTIQFVDRTSLSLSGSEESWAGSSGACGVFDSEPVGQYIVLGLDTGLDGSYLSNLMLVFFQGPEPAGDGYTQAMSRLNDLTQRLTPTAASVVPSATAPPTAAPPTTSRATPAAARSPTPELATTQAPPTPTTAEADPGAQTPEPAVPSPMILVLGLGAVAAGLAAIAFRRGRSQS